MPLKYFCPKCDKRYVDWGAEKLDFKCPDCKDQALQRVGAPPEGAAAAPSLSKSAAKRKAKPKAKTVVGDEALADALPAGAGDDPETSVDATAGLEGEGSTEVIGDSLAIDDE